MEEDTYTEQGVHVKLTCLLRTSLQFLLYASLLLTVPQYVEYEDAYSNEFQDFFGIPTDAFTVSRPLRWYAAASLPSEGQGHASGYHQPRSQSLMQFALQTVLSVILRC